MGNSVAVQAKRRTVPDASGVRAGRATLAKAAGVVALGTILGLARKRLTGVGSPQEANGKTASDSPDAATPAGATSPADETALDGAQTTTSARAGAPSPWLRDALKLAWSHPASVTCALALLAATCFGWAWSMAAVFYSVLGVNPPTVSLSYASVIASAALGLLFVTAVCALAIFGLFALLRLLSRPVPSLETLAGSVRRHIERWLVGVGALTAAGAVALAATGSPGRHWLAALLLGALAVYALLLLSVTRSGFETFEFATIIEGLVLCVVLVVAPVSLLFARAEGLAVRNLGDVDFHAFAALFPWQDRPANVLWHGRPPGPLKACVIYLGQTSNGALVLASDPTGRRRALIVAPSDGVLAIAPTGYGCEWPKVRNA